jgi:hypothetical protein
MAWQLAQFDESLIPAVKALNSRLRAGNMEEGYLFNETGCAAAKTLTPQMKKEQVLLLDGENVRGGALLQHHPFWLSGETSIVTNIQTPVSEGRVNNKFAQAAAIMMSKLQGQNSKLFALGMGDIHQPWPRLLKALKWRVEPMPFYFRVANARAFLKNLAPLNSTRWRRIAASLAANSGVAWAGLTVVRAFKQRSKSSLSARPVSHWDTWADAVWSKAQPEYSLLGRRQAEDLVSFLPIGQRDLVAWRFEDHGTVVGWAAAMVHRIPDSTHFGAMTVGTLLDCLAVPGHEAGIVASASEQMEDLEADILVSNQTHRSWTTALRRSGYFEAPSNYMLGTSPELTRLIQFDKAHITRADGDGRIHL